MKTVHLSPKVNQRKQLNMINDLIIGSSGKGLADESGKCNSNLASPIHGKEQSGARAANYSPGEMKNAITVLVQDGLDLILNVLNNAITLHRRVSGSKHSCTPSKRYIICRMKYMTPIYESFLRLTIYIYKPVMFLLLISDYPSH